MTKYYRMPDGAIVASETDSDASPQLLLETTERPTYDPYGDIVLPRRCELCIYRETCWKLEVASWKDEVAMSMGMPCDIWRPYL